MSVAQSLWRNGIARWTSNPEAPGSSPGRDGSLCVPWCSCVDIFWHVRNVIKTEETRMASSFSEVNHNTQEECMQIYIGGPIF